MFSNPSCRSTTIGHFSRKWYRLGFCECKRPKCETHCTQFCRFTTPNPNGGTSEEKELELRSHFSEDEIDEILNFINAISVENFKEIFGMTARAAMCLSTFRSRLPDGCFKNLFQFQSGLRLSDKKFLSVCNEILKKFSTQNSDNLEYQDDSSQAQDASAWLDRFKSRCLPWPGTENLAGIQSVVGLNFDIFSVRFAKLCLNSSNISYNFEDCGIISLVDDEVRNSKTTKLSTILSRDSLGTLFESVERACEQIPLADCYIFEEKVRIKPPLNPSTASLLQSRLASIVSMVYCCLHFRNLEEQPFFLTLKHKSTAKFFSVPSKGAVDVRSFVADLLFKKTPIQPSGKVVEYENLATLYLWSENHMWSEHKDPKSYDIQGLSNGLLHALLFAELRSLYLDM